MSDLISRQAAIDALEHLTDFVRYDSLKNGETLLFQDSAIELINSLPSAQPERKAGRWIQHGTLWGFDCSECGEWAVVKDKYIHRFKFCPHCGAKMEVEHETDCMAVLQRP